MNNIETYLDHLETEKETIETSQDADLLSFLRQIYRGYSKEEITQFYQWVIEHTQDKLPLTREMKKYIKWDQAEKEAGLKKELLRKQVLEQILKIDHKFDGLNLSKIKSRPVNEENFYSWVRTLVQPELLEDLTIKSIDMGKFDKLYSQGKITYNLEDIPDDICSRKESLRLNISKEKTK